MNLKLNYWYLAALIPVALAFVNGAYGAQLVVVGVTLGIFFGTLSLRRPRAADATHTNPGHG